jgi:hypothetical protein
MILDLVLGKDDTRFVRKLKNVILGVQGRLERYGRKKMKVERKLMNPFVDSDIQVRKYLAPKSLPNRQSNLCRALFSVLREFSSSSPFSTQESRAFV